LSENRKLKKKVCNKYFVLRGMTKAMVGHKRFEKIFFDKMTDNAEV